MSRRMRGIVVGVVVISLALIPALNCGPAAPPSEDDVIHWRMQSTFGPGDFSADILPQFADAVRDKSKGRLEIATFYGDEVVPAIDVWPSVGKGIIEAGQTCGAMWMGTEPVLCFEAGIPFTFQGSYEEVRAAVDEMGLMNIWSEAYAKHNIHLLDIHCYGPYAILCSNVPIRSLDDFKGVKIRAVLWWGNLYKMLGAAPGYCPGGEAYMALKMGTFDAAVYSIDAIRGMKWHEVMDYLILPWWVDWYFGDIIINTDAWNGLPEDLQKALQDAAKEYADANLKLYSDEIDVVIKDAEELGYEVITLPEADVAQIREMTIANIWPPMAQVSPEMADVIEMFNARWGD